MEIVELTTEEKSQKSVLAAFDSVNLIISLNELETLSEEESDTKLRNQKHLEIMMDKEDFVGALTEEQTAEINAVL